jgi:hypothetical protein
MQKLIAASLVLGALIIAAALVHHGRQLSRLSHQLEMLEQRNAHLEITLQDFATNLPPLIEQAGRNAGRQAVRGIWDEAVENPLRQISSRLPTGTNTAETIERVVSEAADFLNERRAPFVRFDISQPIVTIEILGNTKEPSPPPEKELAADLPDSVPEEPHKTRRQK